jgi:hypothetical protein
MCRVNRHWQDGIGAVHGRLLLLPGHRKRVKSGRDPKLWLPGAAGSNPYQGSVVKRADGCIAGAGWPSGKQPVKRHRQASAADFISVAGHSLRLHQTPMEGRCFPWNILRGKQWRPQAPRPRNSSVPSSRSTQSRGLWPMASPVSVGLGGGAATRHLGTDHQEGERERRSNHGVGLRACVQMLPHSRSCI